MVEILESLEQIELLEKIDALAYKVGNTPLLPIRNVFQKKNVSIYAKLEWLQLGNSVKIRAAYHIIRDAIINKRLTDGMHLLDATSGNTGIAYATICKELGIPLTLCLPENASQERKDILKNLGVHIIYTSRFGGTDEAQEKAKSLAKAEPRKYYYADQYKNDANWQAHYLTTCEEILNQTQAHITHFVSGLGTTGTFVGTSRGLKELKPSIQCISLEAETALHGLEGWKHLDTAVVPEIYDSTIADQHLRVSTLASYALIKEVAQKESLLLSPSSAANLAGAIKVAKSIDQGVIVTIFPDNGSKYSEVLNHVFGARLF